MADLLKKHLKKKTEEHSALSVLQNQWGFDEELIPKALQSVGSLFPHYSRHDASHSKQILVNIERLLGDSIQYLTATDTWFLLEAAYWHDIGMVVPHTDIEKALADPEFEAFLFIIKNDPNHELQKFAEKFNVSDMEKCFSGADTPSDAMDKFRQLMSEWFRCIHEKRSNRTVQNPWERAGISSPRTELIPSRLYRLLGRICESHGQDFKKLMAELPFSEAGLAQEDCHPRFIACMLRLGDLLDLDDNRFCPVMQRIAGENRPALSKTHEAKHAAIRHLRMDTQRIEVSAECDGIDEYLETSKWFDWLKQEVQNQQSRWKEIAPCNAFGSLPTMGELVVSIHGELQVLDEGKRPEFSIDSQAFNKLVRGENFYTQDSVWVRELLQNSVDASLVALWLTNNMDQKRFARPDTDEVQALLASKKVQIELKELPQSSAQNQPHDESVWRFTISDCGTGISKEDLRYLLVIGGSHKNSKRQKEISTMPEWMKPSGAFGIGLKAAFLVSQKIKITTKSMLTNEAFEILLHDPSGAQRGLCTIKSLPNDFRLPYGTTVELDLALPKNMGKFPGRYDGSFSSLFFNQCDPISTEYIALGALNLADKIEEYISDNMLSIEAMLDTLAPEETLALRTKNRSDGKKVPYKFFEDCNDHCLQIDFTPTVSVLGHIYSRYRGQEFKHGRRYFPGFNISLDILSGKAGAWLTANRENLRSDSINDFYRTVLAGLECAVRKELEELSNKSENEVQYLSLSLAAMALERGGIWLEFSNKVGHSWKNLPILEDGKSIFELFSEKEITIGVVSPTGTYLDGFEKCSLIIKNEGHLPSLSMIIDAWQEKDGNNTVRVLDMVNNGLDIKVELSQVNEPEPRKAPYELAALANRLRELANRDFAMYTRYQFPDYGMWKKLHLSEEATKALNMRNLFHEKLCHTRTVVLPFLFGQFPHDGLGSITTTSEKLAQLCKWIKPKLAEELSVAEILAEYKKLIRWIDEEVMASYKVEWDKARGITLPEQEN